MKKFSFLQISAIGSVAGLYFYFLIFDFITDPSFGWLRDLAFLGIIGLSLAKVLMDKQNGIIVDLSDFVVPGSSLLSFALFQIRRILDVPAKAGVSNEVSALPKIRDFLLVLIVLFSLVSLFYLILQLISFRSKTVQSEIGKDKKSLLQNTLFSFLYISPILVGVNYLAVQRNYSFDLSSSGKFSYSETSRTILKSIEKDIQVYAFYPRPLEASSKEESWALSALRPDVEIYLQKLQSINSRIQVKFINADVETDKLAEFPQISNGTIVVRSLKSGSNLDGNPYVEEKVVVQSKNDLEDLERKILQAINNVLIPQRKVYFTVQNGERFGQNFTGNPNEQTSKLNNALGFYNFTIRGLTYQEGWPKIPEDADMLFILGPTVPFSEESKVSVLEYVEKRRGKVVITIDPFGKEDFSWLLEKTKLEFRNESLRQVQGRMEIVANSFPDNPITSNLPKKELGVVFPFSGYFDKSPTRTDVLLEDKPLLESGFAAYIDKNKNEKKEPDERQNNFLLGTVLTISNQISTEPPQEGQLTPGRIILFSGNAWLTDKYFLYNLNPGFLTNIVNWLFQNPVIGSILPKKEDVPMITLTPGQKVMIWSIGLFGYPALLAIGLSSYVGYRRKKRIQ